MKSKVLFWGAAVMAVLAFAPASSPAKAMHKARKPAPRYYLALGDSLAVGYQPNSAGVGVETKQGYADQLYAYEKKSLGKLKLVKLGCPGESTSSMITGKGNAGAAVYHCKPPGGSQLKAALKFLRTHHAKNEVPLITIDIGANDVDGCTDPSTLVTCLGAGEKSISTNEPKILAALRKAAPSGTHLASMNLYDPILAAYLDPYSALNQLAEASVTLTSQVNGLIDGAAAKNHFKTADVFDAFKSTDTTPVAFGGASVPTNVVEICRLTWECAPAPVGPNIHANKIGYGVIAGAFEKVLGRLK